MLERVVAAFYLTAARVAIARGDKQGQKGESNTHYVYPSTDEVRLRENRG